MVADASIYGMLRQQPAAPGPLEQYAQGLNVRNLMQAGQLQDVQLKQAERGIADDEAVRAAYQESGGDPAKLRDLLYGRGLHRQVAAAEKTALDTKKTTADIAKTDAETKKIGVETQAANIKMLRDRLATVADDAGLASLRDETVRIYGPQAVASMPQSVSAPEFQNWREQNLMTADKLIVSAEARLTDDRTRKEGALNRDVTTTNALRSDATARRGQDMTNTRALEAAAAAAKKEKSPSDTENVSAGYAARMRNSAQILSDLEKTGIGKPGFAETALSAVGSKMGANLASSPERQKYRQAQEDWVRAKLRKESGAVIADDEMDREIRVYFPQIGDEPETVQQKADSRKQAEISMAQAAGKAKIPDPVTPAGQNASGRIGQPTRADIDAELRRRGVIR